MQHVRAAALELALTVGCARVTFSETLILNSATTQRESGRVCLFFKQFW